MGKIREILKDPDAVNDPPRPFFEHIVALRQCLVNAATAWALSCVVAGIFSPQVLDWLKSPAAALEAADGRFFGPTIIRITASSTSHSPLPTDSNTKANIRQPRYYLCL